jgi:hypothetical protein
MKRSLTDLGEKARSSCAAWAGLGRRGKRRGPSAPVKHAGRRQCAFAEGKQEWLWYLRRNRSAQAKAYATSLAESLELTQEHRPFGFAQGKQEWLCYGGNARGD